MVEGLNCYEEMKEQNNKIPQKENFKEIIPPILKDLRCP